MRQSHIAMLLLATAGLAACAPQATRPGTIAPAVAAPARPDAIAAAVAAPTRTPANLARDPYRHPEATLSFFGVKPSDTVVEIWPAGGWYTEILAPLTREAGAYHAAVFPWPDGAKAVRAKQAADLMAYGHVQFAAFPWEAGQPKVADGSADVVLTFRNVHNWRMGYRREGKDYAAEAFAQMFAMLKPGGTLGIVDHRLPETASDERERTSGYVKTSTIMQFAKAAGFQFVGASEVNANPKDSADWADGVWTLPPSYRLKDVDRAKYQAIGESDRMTLKFRKP